MGDSDYAPFNEAMCVNPATTKVFDDDFIKIRAEGQQFRRKLYKKGYRSVRKLFTKKYKCIVLWFGEENVLPNESIQPSYLEQSYYEGKVY